MRGSYDRQQFEVAPQRWRPRLDQLAAHDLANRVVVVGDFERTQAFAAHPTGLRRVGCTTQVTGQPDHELHAVLLTRSRLEDPASAWSSDAKRPDVRPPRQLAHTSMTIASRPLVSSPPCQQRDRRPGSGQKRAQHIRILEWPAPLGAAAPATPVPADASGPSRPRAAIVLAVLQRVHQRQHALQVEDGVRRGTSRGSAARAFAVARPTAGVATTSADPRGHVHRSARGRCPRPRPPSSARRTSAGAALSACPRLEWRAEQLRSLKVRSLARTP